MCVRTRQVREVFCRQCFTRQINGRSFIVNIEHKHAYSHYYWQEQENGFQRKKVRLRIFFQNKKNIKNIFDFGSTSTHKII